MDDERLLAYLDGRLTPSERQEVEAWLRRDEGARRRVEEHRRVWELLGQAYEEPPLSEAFREETLRRARTTRRTTLRLRVAALLAASVLVVLGLWQRGPADPPDPALLEHLELLEHFDLLEEFADQLDLIEQADLLVAFEGEEPGEGG